MESVASLHSSDNEAGASVLMGSLCYSQGQTSLLSTEEEDLVMNMDKCGSIIEDAAPMKDQVIETNNDQNINNGCSRNKRSKRASRKLQSSVMDSFVHPTPTMM